MLKQILSEAEIDWTDVYQTIQNCASQDLHMAAVTPVESLLAAQPIPKGAHN
jgi:hypothetical protein